MGRRRGRSNKEQRRLRAVRAQQHLTGILQESAAYPEAVVQSAAVHLVKTSRRHRLPIPSSSRDLVCRACTLDFTSGERSVGNFSMLERIFCFNATVPVLQR